MTLKDVFMDTFVPKWIFGAPAQSKQSEANALDAFRHRIDMQQVIYVSLLNVIFVSVALLIA